MATTIDLLLFDADVEQGPSAQTRFGGAPSVASDFSWPVCKTCHGNMQFLGQIRRSSSPRLNLVFMCQNDPGLCHEWDADLGGTAVFCTKAENLMLADVPPQGDVTRPTLYGARIERVEAASYNAARSAWAEANEGGRRDVLGRIGGEPEWLQADETPQCNHCSQPMRFLAQLETGPDYKTEMNFGGGCGYVVECDCEGGVGKFLWQN